jgi:hypothetical protein
MSRCSKQWCAEILRQYWNACGALQSQSTNITVICSSILHALRPCILFGPTPSTSARIVIYMIDVLPNIFEALGDVAGRLEVGVPLANDMQHDGCYSVRRTRNGLMDMSDMIDSVHLEAQ